MNATALLLSFITVISALSGALLLFFIKLDHEKLCKLISFSAGSLFGAAVFVLIPESVNNLDYIETIPGVLSGYLLFWLLTKYYSHVCPACSASHFDERTTKKFSEIVRALIIALSIHCFLDGLAISTERKIHSSVFAAVFTHKFPEGLALASLMLSANYSKSKTFIYVLLVEMVTVLGTIIGDAFMQLYISDILMGLIISHIAGGFIFLATHAVFGEMLKNHTKMVIVSFTLGLIFIFSISKLVH